MSRQPDLSLIGKEFNNLRVDELTNEYNTYNRRLYKCTCLLCGKTRFATKQNLIRGEIKDCGKHRRYVDISGKSFGHLKAICIANQMSNTKNRCKIWRCKCRCGKECNVLYSDLVSGKVQSCGCLKVENIKKLYVNGTAPCKLNGGTIRSTNTSGVTGVWWDGKRRRWCAEIMFKKKKYFLGRYAKKEDAIAVRKEAEKKLFGEFLNKMEYYCNETEV